MARFWDMKTCLPRLIFAAGTFQQSGWERVTWISFCGDSVVPAGHFRFREGTLDGAQDDTPGPPYLESNLIRASPDFSPGKRVSNPRARFIFQLFGFSPGENVPRNSSRL